MYVWNTVSLIYLIFLKLYSYYDFYHFLMVKSGLTPPQSSPYDVPIKIFKTFVKKICIRSLKIIDHIAIWLYFSLLLRMAYGSDQSCPASKIIAYDLSVIFFYIFSWQKSIQLASIDSLHGIATLEISTSLNLTLIQWWIHFKAIKLWGL